ncbi:MAG: phytoene/squalene synthase family protein [Planctomycetota bacterium]
MSSGREALAEMDGVTSASVAYCRALTKASGTSFYWGMRIVPEPKRSAMMTVYAFMRACDDLADDDGGQTLAARFGALADFRQQMEGVLSGQRLDGAGAFAEGWPALRWAVLRYAIEVGLLEAMLDGQRDDLQGQTYRDFDALRKYCYRVASTVGLVCLSIWGYRDGATTRKLAEDRGVAFQLTNILRDVAEDAERGRCYLPMDELERFGVEPMDLRAGAVLDAAKRDRVLRLLQFQVGRARSCFEMSAGLEARLESDSRATCLAMSGRYRRLLDRIAKDPMAVLKGRVRVGKWGKVSVGVKALLGRG